MSHAISEKPLTSDSNSNLIFEIAKNSRLSAPELARASSGQKDEALELMASLLVKNQDFLVSENIKDLENAKKKGLSDAMTDRLLLNPERIRKISDGLVEVSKLKDPVGEITGMQKRPNGLLVGKKRIPLGVIGIIYESRPNVTADAAGLCLKSGNCVILRGGSETINSNLAISKILKNALSKCNLPENCIQVVPSTDRELVLEMLKLEDLIDLIIPRGGEGLIRFVSENSRIPVLKHYKGVCHTYVDEFADLEMAEKICFNAKVQRPGVCNAMETMLVHSSVAREFLPSIIGLFKENRVEIRGCEKTREIVSDITAAKQDDWHNEYLDLILNIKVVESFDQAVEHISSYGSMHTEAIVTESYENAQKFLETVDASAVIVNASTRFNDGNELGLGAEIGISTSKLHAFGPMGLEELTTTKFIIYGGGQIRS